LIFDLINQQHQKMSEEEYFDHIDAEEECMNDHWDFEKRYAIMVNQATEQGKHFDKSVEFKNYLRKVLLVKTCFYCCQPNGTHKFCYIDCMDPKLGYCESNVVPCCRMCIRGKGTLTAQQFLDWIHNFGNVNVPLTELDMRR
jgi:hypothetical protein